MNLFSKVITFNRIKDGKPGAIPVPEGKWDENITYIRNEFKAPFVEHSKQMYLLMKPSAVGVNPQEDYAQNGMNATWVLIPSYEMIIVKAVVADGGLLGDFVFWGGKMFSKQGTDKEGNFSDRYTEYPKGNFIPNYIVDAVTGEVISLKGRFGIFDIVENSIVGRNEIGGDEVVRFTTDLLPAATQFTPTWSSMSFTPPSKQEVFNFTQDKQTPENTYSYKMAFTLPISEIGEYQLVAVTSHPSSLTTSAGANASTYISTTASVKCVVTQQGEIVRSTTVPIKDTYDGEDIEFYVEKVIPCNIELSFSVSFFSRRDGAFKASMDTGFMMVMHKKTPRQGTVIGKDGLYTSFSSLEFLHYKSGQGFTIRAGNYGFRITKQGIQKWSGGKWVAANI